MWRKEDVIEKLRQDQGTRTLREYAGIVGCSAGYLNDVYHNRRDPGSKILDHLKIDLVTTVAYTPKRKWRENEKDSN
jgi:hypothetical protein